MGQLLRPLKLHRVLLQFQYLISITWHLLPLLVLELLLELDYRLWEVNNFTVDVAYSFKTKVINGSEISTRYPLALTVTSKPSWVTNVAITTLSSDKWKLWVNLNLNREYRRINKVWYH